MQLALRSFVSVSTRKGTYQASKRFATFVAHKASGKKVLISQDNLSPLTFSRLTSGLWVPVQYSKFALQRDTHGKGVVAPTFRDTALPYARSISFNPKTRSESLDVIAQKGFLASRHFVDPKATVPELNEKIVRQFLRVEEGILNPSKKQLEDGFAILYSRGVPWEGSLRYPRRNDFVGININPANTLQVAKAVAGSHDSGSTFLVDPKRLSESHAKLTDVAAAFKSLGVKVRYPVDGELVVWNILPAAAIIGRFEIEQFSSKDQEIFEQIVKMTKPGSVSDVFPSADKRDVFVEAD